jgi:hypothetical protein
VDVVARPAHSFQHPAASTLLDLITTQHNKLCIDLHTHTRHTHIEICAQTKKQHLILSKALKSPPPRSPLQLHHHHLLSAAKNLLQILLFPTSPNLTSKIAYQLCQSSTKDWSLRSHLHQRSAYQLHQSSTKDCFPRSSICTKDYLPTSPKIAYNFSNPASQKFAYQLPSKIAHKLQLSQLVGPCSMIMIIFFFFFFFIIIIHVLLSNISFWVSRFGKSSCCSPLPFQAHHHHHHHHISLPSFQAKIQALKNPIHGFCADWVGGWEGGWVGCRAHTDYN